MRRCASCGRAVDDESGVVDHEACPWCGGSLKTDPAGARTLADALQVLWSSDPDAPYDGERAHADLCDLCPRMKGERQAVRQVGEAGALALLRDGEDAGAAKALGDGAHWGGPAVAAFVAAYQSLRPGGNESCEGGGPRREKWEAAREAGEEEERLRGDCGARDAPQESQEPRVASRDTFSGSPGHETTRSVVRPRLADYSWAELKAISRAIAAARSDAEGLAIAGEQNLVDGDGRLRGDGKPVTLRDGTRASVRVAGFRHDTLASGGVAGITFEFAGAPAEHSMNGGETSNGGWEASAMRAWLNSDFLALLPDDLRACVEPARKRTNNRGRGDKKDGTSCVTETTDSLWLLSVSEVYGRLLPQSGNEVWLQPWSPAIYDAEGTQYQLYSDHEVTTQNHSFCEKDDRFTWWLRSPYADRPGYFHDVYYDGVWGYLDADYGCGVSPGFCFSGGDESCERGGPCMEADEEEGLLERQRSDLGTRVAPRERQEAARHITQHLRRLFRFKYNAMSNRTRSVIRPRLAEYSWAELKAISLAIAAAGGDAEGLAIARKYNLVDGDGRLRGDRKPVTLRDGTITSVRVAGFRYDELAFGGIAGITLEFVGAPAEHEMNDKSTNAGGWEASGMRRWLNSDFLALLPDDLRTRVEPARKRTNNRGEVGWGDTSCVTVTTDSLWLLSMSEVYGRLTSQTENIPWWLPAIYDAEGTQYQLYSDQGVTTSDYGFCKKRQRLSWWWLRSPSTYCPDFFHCVLNAVDVGDWNYGRAACVADVSPGFCL